MRVSLVVFNGDKRTEGIFGDADEFMKFFKKMKKEYPQGMFFTVNRSSATAPPKGERLTNTWCPYCRAERTFSYRLHDGVRQCYVCGISDGDFYVRKYNGRL